MADIPAYTPSPVSAGSIHFYSPACFRSRSLPPPPIISLLHPQHPLACPPRHQRTRPQLGPAQRRHIPVLVRHPSPAHTQSWSPAPHVERPPCSVFSSTPHISRHVLSCPRLCPALLRRRLRRRTPTRRTPCRPRKTLRDSCKAPPAVRPTSAPAPWRSSRPPRVIATGGRRNKNHTQ